MNPRTYRRWVRRQIQRGLPTHVDEGRNTVFYITDYDVVQTGIIKAIRAKTWRESLLSTIHISHPSGQHFSYSYGKWHWSRRDAVSAARGMIRSHQEMLERMAHGTAVVRPVDKNIRIVPLSRL